MRAVRPQEEPRPSCARAREDVDVSREVPERLDEEERAVAEEVVAAREGTDARGIVLRGKDARARAGRHRGGEDVGGGCVRIASVEQRLAARAEDERRVGKGRSVADANKE